jgi:hypothetical protein
MMTLSGVIAVQDCDIDSPDRSMLPEFGRRASVISSQETPICATLLR